MKILKYIILSLVAIILATILAIIIYSTMSNRSYNTYIVKDVLKNTDVVLTRDSDQISTYSYEIHITGYIKGSAMLDISPCTQVKLSGKINMTNKVDEYFSEEIYIKYIPHNVEEGNLKIEYRFFCM